MGHVALFYIEAFYLVRDKNRTIEIKLASQMSKMPI